eukprot:gb/GEZN01019334.1/.p1 GENE.gb/GEZN01019334.1/~~gb/GEZN01019334.1/.p1  ORF type:complete len:114 (-),score=4.06 gb/GEZN01019334.1/:381-686(-)
MSLCRIVASRSVLSMATANPRLPLHLTRSVSSFEAYTIAFASNLQPPPKSEPHDVFQDGVHMDFPHVLEDIHDNESGKDVFDRDGDITRRVSVRIAKNVHV